MMSTSKKIISLMLIIGLLLSPLCCTVSASATTLKIGDVIEFGVYPQDEVTDSNYIGETVVYEGKVYAVQPLKWRVLNISNGKALLLTEEIINGKRFNVSSPTANGYKANDYSHSEIREWLNNEFYNEVFKNGDQNAVLSTKLESTTDKVFFLSKTEADTYATKYFSTSATDFAYGNGFKALTSTESCNQWWLRTAASKDYSVYKVEIRWGTWTTYYNWYDDAITYKNGVRPAINLDISQYNTEISKITGIFDSYVYSVMDDGSGAWVSSVKIDGKDYSIQKHVIKSMPHADTFEGKKVIAYLDESDTIYKINIIEEKKTNESNWYQPITNPNVNYGVTENKATRASKVLEATNDFINAMQNYLNMLGDEVDEDEKIVNVNDIVNDLKNGEKACFSLENAPKAAEESVYYAIANFIKDVANNNKIHLKINSSDSEYKQATTLLKSLINSSKNVTKVYEYSNYKVTLENVYLFNQAFYGTIIVEKYKGSDIGTRYIGGFVSDSESTMNVMLAYVNNLGEIVEDECKYALAQIQADFMSVTGLADADESFLKAYFTDKSKALLEGRYGDVLQMFLNIKRSYDAIKKFNDFCRSLGDAETWLSFDGYNNAKIFKTTLDGLKIDYSIEGNVKWCVKSAMKSVEKAQEKLSDELYNYLYDVDTGDPNNKSGWENFWSGNWSCATVQCPVEFDVYDSQGNLLGYVDSTEKHSEYISYNDEIFIVVENDVKNIYYPSDMEIFIKFTAIDDGQMNYSIEQFKNGVPQGKINYFNVPLTLNEQFEQTIPANADLEETAETLTFEHSETVVSGEYISAEEEAYITVDCTSDNQGFAIGGGEYSIGSSVKMMAFADAGYDFQGWYIGDSLISTDIVYQFTATDDTEIIALFEETHGEDEHTFVDGQCTLCAKETDNPSSIQSVEYVQQEDTHKTFTVTCNGRAQMIQFIEPDGGTRTYDRYNKNVTITSYNTNGEIVNGMARDLAYEVWEIYTNLSVGTTVTLRAKFDSIWERDKRSLVVEPYNPIVSMELSSTSGKRGPVPATVVADDKTEKVMFKMPNNTSVTVASTATDENGNKIFKGNAWMNEDGLNEIEVKIYRKNVWKTVGTLEYTVE